MWVNVSTGRKWEAIVGYSRAVRVDKLVFVTGTTATDDNGEIVGESDPYLQTKRALENIQIALEAVGASVTDVVRTRMFVTDIAQWEAIGKAHGEMFGSVLPTTSMIQISALIDPKMLVEIEADAVIPSLRSNRNVRRVEL